MNRIFKKMLKILKITPETGTLIIRFSGDTANRTASYKQLTNGCYEVTVADKLYRITHTTGTVKINGLLSGVYSPYEIINEN